MLKRKKRSYVSNLYNEIVAVTSYKTLSLVLWIYIVTTDVTKPIAVISNSSVTVRCSFISGTRCKGCYVKFMDGNSTLMDRYIARKNMSNTAEEKFFFTGIENIREFSILVFDWESTNITGNLAWPALITMHASTTGMVEDNVSINTSLCYVLYSGCFTRSYNPT